MGKELSSYNTESLTQTVVGSVVEEVLSMFAKLVGELSLVQMSIFVPVPIFIIFH